MDGFGTGLMSFSIVLLVCIALYMLPSFIAYRRDCPNKLAILLVNIFLGWTFVGWFGALIWSVLSFTRKEIA
jgi:hypothetical protein